MGLPSPKPNTHAGQLPLLRLLSHSPPGSDQYLQLFYSNVQRQKVYAKTSFHFIVLIVAAASQELSTLAMLTLAEMTSDPIGTTSGQKIASESRNTGFRVDPSVAT